MAFRRKFMAVGILLVVAAAVGLAIHRGWLRFETEIGEGGNLILYGNVDIRQVELAFNNRERIAVIHVQEGDRVRPGQLMAELETERYEYALARAEAQLAAQEDLVARLEAGTRSEEVRKARADHDAAVAAARESEARFRRTVEAVSTSAVSQQAVDDARGSRDVAVARVAAARAALDLALAGPRKEDIERARSQRSGYEAERNLARRDLKNARLRAPCKGVVQNRLLEVGDMVSPERAVFTVALTTPLWVRAYVDEPDLGRIREGLAAVVTTDSFPGREYEGFVGFISPVAEFTPKPVETTEVRTKLVYQVRVYVKNPRGELRLGMPATVRIPLPEKTGRTGELGDTGPADRPTPSPEPVRTIDQPPSGMLAPNAHPESAKTEQSGALRNQPGADSVGSAERPSWGPAPTEIGRSRAVREQPGADSVGSAERPSWGPAPTEIGRSRAVREQPGADSVGSAERPSWGPAPTEIGRSRAVREQPGADSVGSAERQTRCAADSWSRPGSGPRSASRLEKQMGCSGLVLGQAFRGIGEIGTS